MENKDNSSGSEKLREAVTAARMKEIEHNANDAGLTYYQMMENAGRGAAARIVSRYGATGKKILILCGKGNNGGDGFVVARKLREAGAMVSLALVEGEPQTEDAIQNRKLCQEMQIPEITEGLRDEIRTAMIVVDGIYGTGFHGALREPVRAIARLVNASEAAVCALDVPSGLNGDTGEADPDTIRADETMVFHQWKPAHLMEQCTAFCGETICISIGIEDL